MPTSIIDGSIEAADLRRAKGGASIFRSITFQQADGGTRTIRNAVVKDNVAAELVPGTRGRFYLYNAFDLKGVHGVRTVSGRDIYGFAGNNQKIFLILGIFNLIWIAVMIVLHDRAPRRRPAAGRGVVHSLGRRIYFHEQGPARGAGAV